MAGGSRVPPPHFPFKISSDRDVRIAVLLDLPSAVWFARTAVSCRIFHHNLQGTLCPIAMHFLRCAPKASVGHKLNTSTE